MKITTVLLLIICLAAHTRPWDAIGTVSLATVTPAHLKSGLWTIETNLYVDGDQQITGSLEVGDIHSTDSTVEVYDSLYIDGNLDIGGVFLAGSTGVIVISGEVTSNMTVESIVVRSESTFNYDQDTDGDFVWNSELIAPMVHFDASAAALGIGGSANLSYSVEVAGDWIHLIGDRVFIDAEMTQDAGDVKFNEAGGDYNFGVESSLSEFAFNIDGGTSRVGMGVAAGTYDVSIVSDAPTLEIRSTRTSAATSQAWLAMMNSDPVNQGGWWIGFDSNEYLRFEHEYSGTKFPWMTITNTGLVGIGTQTIPDRLCVYEGAVNVDVFAKFGNSSSGISATDGFDVGIKSYNTSMVLWNHENTDLWFGTNGTSREIITAAGFHGIGVAAPSNALDVAGTIEATAGLTVDTNVLVADGNLNDVSIVGTLTLNGNVTQTAGQQITTSKIQAGSSAGLSLFEDGGAGIFVENGGNVGIGTATPSNKLDVVGTLGITDNITQTAGKQITTSKIQAPSSAGLSLFEDGGAGIFIKNGGYVGIGTTTPLMPLHIRCGTDGNLRVQPAGISQRDGIAILSKNDASNAYKGMQLLGSTVELCIHDVPKLIVNPNGTVTMTAYGAGTATFSAAGVISSASDERLKNIKGDYSQGMDAVKLINPIVYSWKDCTNMENEETKGTEYIGFSAQNIEDTLSRKATGRSKRNDKDKDGEVFETIGIQDRAIMAAMINAIKELETRIKELEK